jgi:NADP-dependent 3-hydroxy acid dehydrogenase YdfG
MFHADLWAPILLARAAIARMRTQRPRGGQLVVVNPVGRGIRPDDPVYCGLCWGLATFAETIRLAYTKDRVRVSVLETGAAYPPRAGVDEPPPSAVAHALIDLLTRPRRVSLNQIVLRPFPPAGIR